MDELVLLAKEQMEKSIESLKNALGTIRTGRASAQLLDRVMVDYYGEPTPLNQIASITIPEPRQLLIKPYDRNDIKSIVVGLNEANLGLTPIIDATQIRLNIPALNEERRRELAKTAKKYCEDGKVAVRNVRREYMDDIKKDKSIPEDTRKGLEADIQKVTDEACKKIDEVYALKEKDIMTI